MNPFYGGDFFPTERGSARGFNLVDRGGVIG